MNGGAIIAKFLAEQGVPFIFTLCGGHISPILVGCKAQGIRVIDTRHEATAVFAADAVARLTGIPGVAAVTAGPGVTNTITAIKNAQLAQSPVLLLGGATATALKGRGALQDIDQMALIRPHVKWARTVRRVRELIPVLQQAFSIARIDIPGPVFVECPVDLLYDEKIVRDWYGVKSQQGKTLADRALRLYLNHHVNRLFAGADREEPKKVPPPRIAKPRAAHVRKAVAMLRRSERPVLLVGSQVMLDAQRVREIGSAVDRLGLPVYLSGMARGLLGKNHPLHMRHRRRAALREADLVLLAGVPCDFRLDYGRHIGRTAKLISANRRAADLKKNRRPQLAVHADPGQFLLDLAESLRPANAWPDWVQKLRQSDETREQELVEMAGKEETGYLNPVYVCLELARAAGDNSLFVADGGDFVATASYAVRPPGPLTWLDPGVFGTLGVGAGFALGAKLCHPESEVWLIYGDGAAGFSLAEYDTFVRHGIALIGIVGNDASWMQIAREQVEILKDDVGTVLQRTAYHHVVEGFGAQGFLVQDEDALRPTLQKARHAAAAGKAVLINTLLGKTEFRKGSISM